MLLKVGSKGEDVKKLQEKLGTTADGDFGPGTEKLVKEWQAANGLTADGLVGDGTWAKMFGSAPVAAPAPAASPRPVGPRRARLLLTRLDPGSVMKTAFMISISIAVVLLVATGVLWWVLDVTGVFAAIGRTVNDIAGTSTTSFDFMSLVSFSRVMGLTLVLAAVEIVLGSALATLFAFLYNLSVGLTGGLEVTLSEDS